MLSDVACVLAGVPRKNHLRAIRDALLKSNDGGAPWLNVFKKVVEDPAKAVADEKLSFDDLMGWSKVCSLGEVRSLGEG